MIADYKPEPLPDQLLAAYMTGDERVPTDEIAFMHECSEDAICARIDALRVSGRVYALARAWEREQAAARPVTDAELDVLIAKMRYELRDV